MSIKLKQDAAQNFFHSSQLNDTSNGNSQHAPIIRLVNCQHIDMPVLFIWRLKTLNFA